VVGILFNYYGLIADATGRTFYKVRPGNRMIPGDPAFFGIRIACNPNPSKGGAKEYHSLPIDMRTHNSEIREYLISGISIHL
jgi:hypothetical protein